MTNYIQVYMSIYIHITCVNLDIICHRSPTIIISFIVLGKSSSSEDEDGTGTGRSEIRIQLGRGDLGNRLTCKSENEALPANQPLHKSVQVDINRKFYIVY